MRTWTRLALAVLLAASFTLTPVYADPEDTPDQKVKRLESELQKLRKDLDDLREKVVDSSLRRNATSADLGKLRERLAILEQMVVRHDDLMKTPITRQSAYGPGFAPGNGNPPAPATALVTIRNQYMVPATVRINGQSIAVEAGETKLIPGVPLGRMTYDVFVEGYALIQPAPVTLLARGRVINIFPQP